MLQRPVLPSYRIIKCTDEQPHKHTDEQPHKHTDEQPYKCTNEQPYKHTNRCAEYGLSAAVSH
jgi:hypothetical protein